MARILFVHNGSPGRFTFLARLLMDRGHSCAVLNSTDGTDIPGVPTMHWRPEQGTTNGIFAPAVRVEADLIRAFAAAEAARKMREAGFVPDLIIGHPGWGEMALLREVFPDARQIHIGEYYYRAKGADVDFDPEFALKDFRKSLGVPAKNPVLAMSFIEADRIVAPTPFQASLLPEILQSRVAVIHEGVDTELARPNPDVRVHLPGGQVLTRSRPVVTFINRAFEPLRGVHIFMRALPRILAEVPDVDVLMIGADASPAYGLRPQSAPTWKAAMLAELEGRLDLSRIHFTGQLTYPQLVAALSASAAHVYLTYPFVLSWSLLDAMSCECLVIGSDTAPVRDVLTDGVDGRLVDFFDVDGLALAVAEACRRPEAYAGLRRAARAKMVAQYDRRTVTEPAWLRLIDELLPARG